MSLWSVVCVLALYSACGCVGDALAQQAGSNPDPHARTMRPGPSVLDVMRRGDAGAATTGDAGAALGSIGDHIGGSFGAGGLGMRGGGPRYDGGVLVTAGTIGRGGGVGGGGGIGMGSMSSGGARHARFEELAITGPLPRWHVQSVLQMLANRTSFCVLSGRREGRYDVAVRFELGAPPAPPRGEYMTTDAVLRRCLAAGLTQARLMPSTPVTRVTARFRMGDAPGGGR